jgi:C4-dicarboxylate-specific signal transduction histidine kinase
MMEAGQIERREQYYGSESPPESIALHFVPFQQGMIYVGAPAELNDTDLEVVRSLADAFAVAYARYDDFQTTDKALKELRLTQKQLIEQEKLASLGSLTAGIAHEIKNPLNFVNNFAEVSAELAQELSEAVAKGETSDVQTILDDLIQNATQITKHGKRADSIVRSMMQHARGGMSERESIDVNEFIEEYVNLAWHGMRARDHGFQAEVVKKYEENLGSISVLPQEIGRVILNLLNNAFYAVASDDRPGTEQLVTVSTRRTNESIEITVGDNGPGIPPDVREKIFEPFFTTKPTGEGTGLGLSLSYDIVTKGHGGEMSVGESSSGGAEFRVVLPA